tara:strand:+ start:429 stop:692 length:264 start_codon:yes stop_codon:yes gene_type:complete
MLSIRPKAQQKHMSSKRTTIPIRIVTNPPIPIFSCSIDTLLISVVVKKTKHEGLYSPLKKKHRKKATNEIRLLPILAFVVFALSSSF